MSFWAKTSANSKRITAKRVRFLRTLPCTCLLLHSHCSTLRLAYTSPVFLLMFAWLCRATDMPLKPEGLRGASDVSSDSKQQRNCCAHPGVHSHAAENRHERRGRADTTDLILPHTQISLHANSANSAHYLDPECKISNDRKWMDVYLPCQRSHISQIALHHFFGRK